jgi:hypothetical protein
MSKQLIFSMALEFWLVFLTIVLLTQPSFIFRGNQGKQRLSLTMSGMFMLCVTFCWSVVLGCVIAFQRAVISL